MNLSGLVDVHDIPWWGWVACAAGTALLSLTCVAFGATAKRGSHGLMTMLAAVLLLACLFCTVTGIVKFFQPY